MYVCMYVHMYVCVHTYVMLLRMHKPCFVTYMYVATYIRTYTYTGA